MVCRYPGSIARFKMLAHPLVEENPDLTELTEQSRAGQLAGEGVAEVAYTAATTLHPLYTTITIRLQQPNLKVRILAHGAFSSTWPSYCQLSFFLKYYYRNQWAG